jgi:hypothetical protein
MQLFAETSDGGVAGIALLASLVGGAAVWLAGQFWKWWDARRADRDAISDRKRKEKKEDDTEIVGHYKILQERMDRKAEEQDRRIDHLQSDLTNTLAHVRYLEGIMESKGIPFRPFDLNTLGSSVHRALADGIGE